MTFGKYPYLFKQTLGLRIPGHIAGYWREKSRAIMRELNRFLPAYIPVAYKLALAISLLIILGMGLLGLVIVANQERLLREQMDKLGFALVNQLAESSKEMLLSDDELGLKTLLTNLAGSESVKGVALFSETGIAIFSRGAIPEEHDFSLKPNVTRDHQIVRNISWLMQTEKLVSYVAPMTFKKLTVGYALVTLSRMPMMESVRHASQAILIATLLMSFLAIVVALFMSRHLSKPLHALMAATRAIGQGRYDYRIPERRNDEIGHLINAFNSMADGLLRKSQVENIFSRYVPNNIAREILNNLDQVKLGGRRIIGTVLFADIVGFTAMSEKMQPDEISKLLNEYFSYISLASKCYRGTIDKFIGDCVMVVFGLNGNDNDHLFNALACGVLIQRLAARLNEKRVLQTGKPLVNFRIGINSGEMLAGNLGSDDRMEYTVVGDAVNLASRLSSVAEGGQIILRQELYEAEGLRKRVIAVEHKTIRVRGKTDSITTYNVSDVTTAYRTTMNTQLEELLIVCRELNNPIHA